MTPGDGFAGGAPDRVVPVRSDGLGARFGAHKLAITKRRTMAYAAGIGAADGRYLDDARRQGVVAPLGIVAALEWPVFESEDYLAAIGRTPATAFNGLVHGAQVSHFARPIRPGDRLEIAARIVEMRETRAGALVTSRIDTADAASGAPVATGWFGALYRGTPLDGAPGTAEEVPALRAVAGIEHAAHVFDISVAKAQAHLYTECAGIWNPIHTEREYALASGLPDIILHGTCTWAMALERIAAGFAPDSPLPFRAFGARFSAPVIPGDTVRVEASDPRQGCVAFVVRDAGGGLALSHGFAELA
jgi:acyl dehydratase